RPLVALHGLRGHGRRWRPLADHHLPECRVYAPDLRGHGLSGQEPPWTLEQHAEDVLAAMDHAGLDRAGLVGHSMGATVAVYLARRAPDRVDRLILLDPSAGIPATVAGREAQEAIRPPEFVSPREAAHERAATWPAQARPLVDEEIRTHLARGDDGRWRWRYHVPAVVTAFSELARPAVLPPPDLPTLLVLAIRSRAVGPDYIDDCRAILDDQLSVVQVDCGHQIYLERAKETGRLIRRHLELPVHRHRSIG
ncbi:MAG TPA: alpha/beta fold hydrolase, partial [Micromonosporaceae bacterium]|nr:alpha/beta fold hydrolase [Micromonosporaceae bacterium]